MAVKRLDIFCPTCGADDRRCTDPWHLDRDRHTLLDLSGPPARWWGLIVAVVASGSVCGLAVWLWL